MEINISKKYEPLFNIPEGVDTFVLTGGRFSAKSWTVSTAATYWAAKLEHRILYTRYTNVSAKDSIIPEFEEKINLLNWERFFEINQSRIEGIHNDSKIVFKGLKTGSSNQTANLKSIKDFSCWILEEAEELQDESMYDKIALSVRGNSNQSKHRNLKVLILNPTTKEHWIYNKFFEDRGVDQGFNGVKDNVCYIHTSYLDCEQHVPSEIIDEFNRMKINNPDKYNHIVLGGWLNRAEGVVYDNWESGVFDDSLPYIYGQDFGFSIDPTTLCKVAIDDKKKFIYLKELLYKTNLSTSEIIDVNKENTLNNDLIIADSAEPRLISELKKANINVKAAVKGPDSVRTGISKIKDYKLIIDNDSVNLKKELNNYVWSDSKSNTPKDCYNHLLDAARYAVSYLKIKKKKRYLK